MSTLENAEPLTIEYHITITKHGNYTVDRTCERYWLLHVRMNVGELRSLGAVLMIIGDDAQYFLQEGGKITITLNPFGEDEHV